MTSPREGTSSQKGVRGAREVHRGERSTPFPGTYIVAGLSTSTRRKGTIRLTRTRRSCNRTTHDALPHAYGDGRKAWAQVGGGGGALSRTSKTCGTIPNPCGIEGCGESGEAHEGRRSCACGSMTSPREGTSSQKGVRGAREVHRGERSTPFPGTYIVAGLLTSTRRKGT
jgi:hypothetical protein